MTGDFDGDLRTDFVVVRPNQPGAQPTYTWFLAQTNFNFGFNLLAFWGTAGDQIVPADYDGNGKDDIAVFRPSNGQWYIIPSNAQNALNTARLGFEWGLSGDVPQPADYDGDLISDVGVFRPSDGNWFLRRSATNTFSIVNWGTSTDIPATAPYPIRP